MTRLYMSTLLLLLSNITYSQILYPGEQIKVKDTLFVQKLDIEVKQVHEISTLRKIVDTQSVTISLYKDETSELLEELELEKSSKGRYKVISAFSILVTVISLIL